MSQNKFDLDFDASSEYQKIEEQIRKLQEKKKELAEKAEEGKQLNELARRVGKLILVKYQGKRFDYDELERELSEYLISDFDRQFFGLEPLAEHDQRRPKKRGRKKKTEG